MDDIKYQEVRESLKSINDHKIQALCFQFMVTPQELAGFTDIELLRQPNFGKVSLAKLRKLFGPGNQQLIHDLSLHSSAELIWELKRRGITRI